MIGAGTDPADIKRLIAHAYAQGGYQHGWRYIYGQAASRVAPHIVTIGLNPGGGRGESPEYQNDDRLTLDETAPSVINSYFCEHWAGGDKFTPLQAQIQKLRNRHFPDVDIDKILSFQFIPFRSASWNELPSGERQNAIDLGARLLDWTLGRAGTPKLIVGFGLRDVENRLLEWFEAELAESCPTGWGKTKTRIYSTPKADRLVLLPHLSRYQVIGRPQFDRESYVFTGIEADDVAR